MRRRAGSVGAEAWRLRYRRSLKERPAPEFVNAVLFRPLGFLVASGLARTPVRPLHLVLLHTLLGFVAASALVCRRDRLAALLLQIVTVLDNADGQLARLRREESELGRYADTELDALKNLAIFAAIGHRTKRWRAALAGFFVLMLLLSWDFNVEYLYRSVRGERFRPAVRDANGVWLTVGRWVYRWFFAPQDRAVRWFERQLFRILTRQSVDDPASARVWWSRSVVLLAANLGLSTQYLWLGCFALAARLERYLDFVLAQGLVPVCALGWRWWLWKRRSGRGLASH
jgi:phosphatidylglycerophosphate synthase